MEERQFTEVYLSIDVIQVNTYMTIPFSQLLRHFNHFIKPGWFLDFFCGLWMTLLKGQMIEVGVKEVEFYITNASVRGNE